MKSLCSFSLAKLMQSCSSEFTSKISKPKMSTNPIECAVDVEPPPSISSLIVVTSHENIAAYLCRRAREKSV